MIYYENVPMDIFNNMKKSDEYIEKFNFFWNFEILNPTIDDFVKYANKYMSEECVSGRIEFVNNGNKVNITYLG